MFNIPYSKFKLTIVLLIMLNAVIYVLADTLTNAVDALAWLSLLVLYELETYNVALIARIWLHRLRGFLIVVIVLVFISYVHSGEWLDVVNSALWFTLIALLELEVHWSDKVFKYQQSYWWVTVAVFAGLIMVVVVWAWQSAWLDAYDATLWIIAFGAIEADIFQVLQRKRPVNLSGKPF